MRRIVSYQDATTNGTWREVAPDILTIPFWQAGFCQELIATADLLDEYQPYGADVKNNAAPGQELRINRISPKFAEHFEADFAKRIVPIIRTHWWPLKVGKTRMPFVLRYSPDTQASLDPHHDSAMVSFAMPLNTGYEGGYLTFPRQHWDSREIPIGYLIAFPGRVTHVHYVTPVTTGIRYSMTTWIATPNENPFDAII